MSSRLLCVLLLTASFSAQQATPSPAVHSPAAAPVAQGFRMAGIVVNALSGQPVASASVAIAPVSHGEERDISRSFTTGSDGRFVFTGLPRGKYSMMAEARGFSIQFFEHHDPYATAVAVGPDIESENLVFRLQPDASVAGDVTDENNEPIRFAQVRLFRRDTAEGRQRTYPINMAQTDDQGHYHMGHLPPGTYYLAVSARPWYAQNESTRPPKGSAYSEADARAAQDAAALDVTYPLTYYAGTTDSADATALQLAPGEKETADVVLHASPALHLRVHTGGADSPVLGRMIFPRVSHRVFDDYVDSVANAPDSWVAPGVIEISGLAPGHYIIEMPASVDDKGSARAWYREVDLAGDMDISAAEGPGFATVGGTILFEGLTRAPKDASLALLNRETGESFRADVSEKGEFSFPSDDIRPGRYLVQLDSPGGFFLRTITAAGAKIAGRTIEITGSGNVRINGAATTGLAQVNGTATRDGQPYSGAMIVLVPQDPANNVSLFRRDQSDSDGTFTLPQVVPGQYTVIAIANGWDLEWANPAVLQRYLKQGESVQVPAEGKLQVKVQVQ